eukprot:4039779-Amphidinium_carterae.1
MQSSAPAAEGSQTRGGAGLHPPPLKKAKAKSFAKAKPSPPSPSSEVKKDDCGCGRQHSPDEEGLEQDAVGGRQVEALHRARRGLGMGQGLEGLGGCLPTHIYRSSTAAPLSWYLLSMQLLYL